MPHRPSHPEPHPPPRSRSANTSRSSHTSGWRGYLPNGRQTGADHLQPLPLSGRHSGRSIPDRCGAGDAASRAPVRQRSLFRAPLRPNLFRSGRAAEPVLRPRPVARESTVPRRGTVGVRTTRSHPGRCRVAPAIRLLPQPGCHRSAGHPEDGPRSPTSRRCMPLRVGVSPGKHRDPDLRGDRIRLGESSTGRAHRRPWSHPSRRMEKSEDPPPPR